MKLLIVYATLMLTPIRAEVLARETIARVENDTGVKIEEYRVIPEKRLKRLDILRTPALLYDHQRFFRRYWRGGRNSSHVLIVAPAGRHPFFNVPTLTGEAMVCGPWGIVGYSRALPMWINTIAAAHELGHMLGANHSPRAGIMFSAAPQIAERSQEDLHFTDDSITEINECQSKTPQEN
ncbi:MAG: hypothetical protein E6R03_04100 [Hyphomicrobiaceae bacterium]|nr:MAG: hypothetical protein E6R03_04100 [Hyphomicrobiaceae bacterium]